MQSRFSLRRYTAEKDNDHSNRWVADLAEANGIYSAVLSKAGIYCIYPGRREHSFFAVEDVPFWLFCDAQHVGQGRVHDVYPYFEAPPPASDGPHTLFLVVAPTLEEAKSKLLK